MKSNILQFAEGATGGDLRNFAKFTGKQLCQSLFLYKVTGHSLQLY